MYLNECSFLLCSHLSLTGGVVTAGLAIYDTIQVSVTSVFVWFLKLYEEHSLRMKLYEECSLRMKLYEERAWKSNAVTTLVYITSFFLQYIQPPVATWCVGQACSMGSLLLSAGAPGLRHALPHSRIMLHQPHGGTQVGETNEKVLVSFTTVCLFWRKIFYKQGEQFLFLRFRYKVYDSGNFFLQL